MKRLFLLIFCLSLTALPGASESRPNVLIIYADDLGYGDVHCYNPKRGKIPTPCMDKLASEGMRFTDAHSSSGVCTPSRYTLLTGRYHWRSRLQSGIVSLWERPLITPDRLTIAGLARDNGYRTACVGKWHLGWNWQIPKDNLKYFRGGRGDANKDLVTTKEHIAAWQDVFSKPIKGGPLSVGFDEYFGTDVPNWPPFCYIENDRTVGIPSQFAAKKLFEKNQGSQQGPSLPDWSFEPILPALADRAEKIIMRDSDKPFFIYMPLTAPHTPLSVNEEWMGKSGLNLYADFVMETDAIVGRVLDALEKSGKAKNTLVIFTSDNGMAHYVGSKELEEQGHYPSGPYRGYKSDAWEGGHRVPFIVRWDGMVKSGTVCDELVHQADIMATLADVIDTEVPDGAGEDSFSILPLLKGGNEPIRENAISASIRGVPALRLGSWKYIPDSGSGGWTKGGDNTHPCQLYDLAKDPGETENLAAGNAERVSEMQALLEEIIVNGRSTAGPKSKNDVQVKRYKVDIR